MQRGTDIRKEELQKLYKELAPVARAFLRKQGCSETDSEDYIQEAFLRLWDRKIMIPKGLEQPYLNRMLKNLMIDDFRRMKKQRTSVSAFDDKVYEVPAVDERSNQEAQRLLWKHLSEVSRDPKAISFLLQVKQGLTMEQIARQKQVPVGTIAAQISRYRSHFKDSFQKAWESSVWC